MVLRRIRLFVPSIAIVLIGLAACGSQRSKSIAVAPGSPSKTQPVRANEEHACISNRLVRENRFIQQRSALGGPNSRCGAFRPYVVSAVDSGRVQLRPKATLRCPMVPAVDRWVSEVVIPASIRHLGSPVTALKVAASYSCRNRNSKAFTKLSEHGLANALDVSAFDLADGRRVTVLKGWRRGSRQEAAFLRAVHKSACRHFTTVLGPNADRYHQDHFHFDLARHNAKNNYRYCR
ncbi:MAG: extensin family protein [Pseudomonadota bacterium]